MTKLQFYGILGGLCIAAYSYLGFSYQQSHTAPATFCVFKSATGVPCPACGTTRSVQHITKANFGAALKINPLGFLTFGVLLVSPFWLLADALKRKDSYYRFYQRIENGLKRKIIAIPITLLLLANWCWNIYKGL